MITRITRNRLQTAYLLVGVEEGDLTKSDTSRKY